jgi:SNF2 family DNA or RNA helicase
MLALKVTQLNGTPVFVAASPDARLAAAYGAVRFKNDPLCYFPAFYPCHRIVLEDLRKLDFEVSLSEQAQKVVTHFDTIAAKIAARELPNGFEFKTQPFEHQTEGLVHLIYNFRAGLFYSCGLGKTKIVIDWQRATQCWPLVLCPKVVLHVWAAELKRHGIQQEFAIIDAASKAEKTRQVADAKNYQGAVITYDSARRYYEELAVQVPYDAIVADESHCVKDPSSQRTKAALVLSGKAARRVIMSGTPSLGDPRDMYSQLEFLGSFFVPESFWKFRQTFCIISPRNKHIVTGFKNLDVLRDRVMFVALQKAKADCLDLPERHIIDVLVPLVGAQMRLYNTLIASEEMQEAVDSLLLHGPGEVNVPNAAVLINKLLQVVCGFVYKSVEETGICNGCPELRECSPANIQPYTAQCKKESKPLEPVVEYFEENAKRDMLLQKLEDILEDPKNKVIIWGQFSAELTLIENVIKEKWGYVRVDGSNTSRIVHAEKCFNENPLCRIYLGQVETGVGITLNAANYMIYYSLPWKLVAYHQSLDRNHRVGQTQSVTVFRLLAEQSVDVGVRQALDTKMTVAATLTTALLCPACSTKECAGDLSKMFSKECAYSRSIARPITKAKRIESSRRGVEE